MANPGCYKPANRLTGKQPPPIVAQLHDVLDKKEITLENNEDKEEKQRMETLMKDIQVQPWWQYEDDITMFSEQSVKDAMNKELSQLINKKSFEEVDSRTLTPQQLQHAVATRCVITQRPTSNGQKTTSAAYVAMHFQHASMTLTQTCAATPSSMAMRLPITNVQNRFIPSVFLTDGGNSFNSL
eukprot:4063938-Amphidinium_carterae.1